jgi:hypothetical protein
MAHVTGFSHDVFISYSHLDDQAVGGEGWVTSFHKRLQIELDEELGEKAVVWRDGRIGSADDFTADLEKELRGSAVLIAIVSPGYLNSRWCDWELKGFVDGPRRTGDLWVDAKSRAIKVIKRPADQNAHREAILRETTGKEFFETDSTTGRSYELAVDSDVYHRRLTELAQDICHILRVLRRDRTVFLGSAPAALTAQRTKVSEELNARQYRVLSAPEEGISGATEIVRQAVQESSLSIHFIDRQSDGATAGSTDALAAAERDIASRAGLRQVVVVRDRESPAGQTWDLGGDAVGSDVEVLVDPPTYALKETVLQKLGKPVERAAPQRLVRVYLICERQDHPLLAANRARSLRDHLMRLGLEVKVPLAEGGDAAEFSRDNRTKLRTCDGVLLYWGGSRQGWFEERLIELTQALGWRRGRSFAASAAYVANPPNPVKENYETREVEELIKQFDALDVGDERLVRFIERLAHTA